MQARSLRSMTKFSSATTSVELFQGRPISQLVLLSFYLLLPYYFLNLVDRSGVEPLSSTCKAEVISRIRTAQIKMTSAYCRISRDRFCTIRYSLWSILVVHVGFEPTHPEGTDLQSAATLQLRRHTRKRKNVSYLLTAR